MARSNDGARDEARRLHAEGMSHTDIARRLGVHRTTVHYMVGKPSARPNATAAEETAAETEKRMQDHDALIAKYADGPPPGAKLPANT